MLNRRLITWVVAAAVVVLLAVAVADALRSSPDGETVAPPTETVARPAPAASTATAELTTGTPRCARDDLKISIEVREKVVSGVVRNIGAGACQRLLRGWHIKITDRAGRVVDEWAKEQLPVQPLIEGDFGAGDEVHFWIAEKRVCHSSGPYHARLTVGPYSARLDDLPSRAIRCI
jgi:hypothetical protein